MTSPDAYRRFGAAFTGTRPTLKLGDPGIDAAWLRRYHSGVIVCATWYTAVPILLGIGFFSTWGVFGAVDTWQLETFGSNNVILRVILFMPLAFLPYGIARASRVSAATPFRLGTRQAFDNAWGPRVIGKPSDRQQRTRRAIRVAQGIAVVGATALAFFIGKGFHDANQVHALLPNVTYAQLVDVGHPLATAVRVTDAQADRSRSWAHDYRIRQTAYHDVYLPLLPIHGRRDAPIALMELDAVSPDYGEAPWNMIDPPGAREGTPEVLDTWTGDQLRRAGFHLAGRVVLLKRQQLDGLDPTPDPLDDYVFGLFGFVAMLCGILMWWIAVRTKRATELGKSR